MLKNKTISRGMTGAALILFVYALSTESLSVHLQNTRELLANASVGVMVGVPPNPYNTIAQQLEAKQNELSEREQKLAELEKSAAPAPGTSSSANDFATYSLGMSILLFLLVATNFYYDWRRARREIQKTPDQFAINLNKRG